MSHMTPAELVHRSRGGPNEAPKDRAMLRWIGRFRYTSVELLALRFGVAAQNVRVRLKRLQAAGLVRLERRSLTDPWIVSLTSAGADALGQPRRKRPRADLHQAHELAIGWLCARVETSAKHAGLVAQTEREMRSRDHALKHAYEPLRYRLDVVTFGSRNDRTRWPDLALERDGRLLGAIEIEFTHKATARLEAILDGYLRGRYPQVTYLTTDPGLAAKLARLGSTKRFDVFGEAERVRFEVKPWPAANATTQARVAASIQRVKEDLGLASDEEAWLGGTQDVCLDGELPV
jgi:DNA-binding transcriptional ArsR family regulator